MAMGVIPWGDGPIIEWDESNEEHVARHGVTPAEVDSLLEQGEFECRLHNKKRRGGKFAARYLLEGATLGGRRLLVVVDHVGECRIRPVTAFDNE